MKKYGLEAEFLSVKRYTWRYLNVFHRRLILSVTWLYSVYHETFPKRRI